ncbi:MAG: peptidase U32 family protein [bacterium]
MNNNLKKIELLAPGGDEDAVKAAILAGADAIYLGLSRFNARLKATNISEERLPFLTNLAHSRGVKIYVTINTLITNPEVEDFVQLVGLCLKAGVDAFIVQDIGALYLINKLYPEAHLHASTQLTIHNSKQLEFLKRFNVRQVNLCREMSLEEIKGIISHADQLNLKVEVFVHGAYCISFSGQCLMSSFIGGCSANRGLCAQPCRKRYSLKKGRIGEKYRLSLKDNNAFAKAEALLKANVSSLKIEGRMKNFYYVYNIVQAWRGQLDKIYSGHPANPDDPCLHKVFNRKFSIGYLEDKMSQEMFVDSPMDNSLTFVGKVKRYLAGQQLLELTNKNDLNKGSRINIYTKDNQFVCTATIENIKTASAFYIRLEHLIRQKILNGQIVYTLRDKEEMAAIQTRLKRILIKEEPLKFKVEEVDSKSFKNFLQNKSKLIPKESKLALLISNPNEVKIFTSKAETILLEINSANELSKVINSSTWNHNVIPFFSPIIFERELGQLVSVLDRDRCSRIVANNYGLGVAAIDKGIDWIAGQALNCTNSYTALALEAVGRTKGAFVSLELNTRQIGELVNTYSGETWLTISGPLLVMTTRQCLLRDTSNCLRRYCNRECLTNCQQYTTWYDEKNVPFHIYKKPGSYTQIFNDAILFFPKVINLFKGEIDHFVLDLRNYPFYNLSLDEKKLIVDYFKNILLGKEEGNQDKQKEIKKILPNTTTGHFRRGI